MRAQSCPTVQSQPVSLLEAYLHLMYEEGPMRSELKLDYSKGVSSSGNTAVHA